MEEGFCRSGNNANVCNLVIVMDVCTVHRRVVYLWRRVPQKNVTRAIEGEAHKYSTAIGGKIPRTRSAFLG